MRLPEKQIRYIDLTDVSETFADSLGLTIFDGQSTRIELCITRFDAPNPPNAPTARKYPACRLVLTPEVTIDLFNQLQNMVKVMQQQGLVTKGEPPKSSATH